MSPINSLWFKWKSLRLPWRRSFLVGTDLSGNTYWEFKDALNASRYRRIVKYTSKTHYADVQVTPQWHQWLRHVRANPPSIEEQQQDLIRQMQIKQLAQLADQRWASKPSYLDSPRTQQPAPATRTSDATINPPKEVPGKKPATHNAVSSPVTAGQTRDGVPAAKEGPWAKARTGDEKWQPESWTPSASRR